MKKYKYSWDDIENYNSVVKQSDVLKKRGDDGWELVSTILIGTLTRIRFYWKKEISKNEK